MESETELANGDTIKNLVDLPVEFIRRRSSTRENSKHTIMSGSVEYRRKSTTRDYPIIPGSVEYSRRQSIQRENSENTIPGSVEWRRRSSARDYPIIPGSVEHSRRRSSTREIPVGFPVAAESPRRSITNDNPGPGGVEYPRRRSSTRDKPKGSLQMPGFTESQKRRNSVMSLNPGQLLSWRPSLIPVSSDRNVRSHKASVTLPTLPNTRPRRTSVIQIQNFTKTRSNIGTLKSRRGSKNKKEKLFQPLECFRRIARIVRTLLRVGNALKSDPKRDLGEGICKSFLEMMEGYMMMKNKAFITSLPAADTGPALFDPTLFKANKEIQISKEVRNILSLRADERTTDQLKTVLYACQTLSAFAELPLHMQESICKVAWHQSLPANKIIIKQGHLPENFYFIMSGTVTVLSENDPTKEDENVFTSLATLKRGNSFGDTAILKPCRRTATVVSKDAVQLLVIGREDYQSIFMGRSKNGEEPRHIKFCRTLGFLAGFPIDLLIDNHTDCMFHYFRRGTVIVKDSRKSEWVYIVVSGMCEVILNLEVVTPKLTGKQIDGEVSHVEMLTYLTEERYSNLSQQALSSNKKAQKETAKNRPSSCDLRHIKTKSRNSSSSQRKRVIRSALSESALSTGRHSTLSDNSSGRNRSSTTSIFPVTDMNSVTQTKSKKQVFARIDIRHPRTVFGLSNLDFDNTGDISETASVSLVSRGAECVMISKKFFIAHAKEHTKAWTRHNVVPYPTKDVLQKNLQQKVNWNAYKQDIIHKIKAA